MPTFWLGLLFIIVLAVGLHWLPVLGRISTLRMIEPPVVTHLLIVDSLLAADWVVLQDAVKHIVLPALMLCGLAGRPSSHDNHVPRCSKQSAETHVRTARAKGLGERVGSYPPRLP